MLVKQDALSYGLSGFALVGFAFLSTFGGYLVIPTLIGLALLFGSLIMAQRQKVEEEDDDEGFGTVYWQLVFALGGLVVILFAALYVPQIQFTPGQTVTINAFFGVFTFPSAGLFPLTLLSLFSPIFFFGVFLIPPSEEQFFRGWITNLALKVGGPMLAIPVSGIAFAVLPLVISAVTFAVFHFGVYGFTMQTFLILMGSGSVMAFIDIQTGRVSTSMIAHILNNALAFGLQGNILSGFIPQFILPAAQFAPLVFPLLFASVLIFRRRQTFRL